MIASGRAASASSGMISGVGFASARMMGFGPMLRTIACVMVPGPERPRKMSAARDGVVERACVGVERVALLLFVQVRPSGVYDALAVAYRDVVLRDAELAQEVEAGDRCGPCARAHNPHCVWRLADDPERVERSGGDADRGAVLIVVEHRDVEALLETALDLEALGSLDVLKVDCAEGRLQAGYGLHQRIDVAFVDLDVEDVDVGELLEEDRLAFHDRLRSEGADGAEAQHRAAVADHRDQIGSDGVVPGPCRVLRDLLAGRGHARAVGKRQIALRAHALGGMDAELARLGLAVIVERRLTQVFRHGVPLLRFRCAVPPGLWSQRFSIANRIGCQPASFARAGVRSLVYGTRRRQREAVMAFTEVNGARLWYEATGDGAPVVHIHGAGFGHFNFATATPIASKFFRCIDFDMRGYGESDKPIQLYDMEVWADDVAGLMDTLKIERAHIHGTSMGGMIAQVFGAKYADRTDRLVINCSAAKLDLAGRLTFQNWIDISEAYGCGSRTLAELIAVQALSRKFLDGPDGPGAIDMIQDILEALKPQGKSTSGPAAR